MYSFDSRVRYSECNQNGVLSIEGMMNYLQDCSTFQSEYLGMGIEFLRKNHFAWWLQAWQIDIEYFPKLGDEIRIGTWAYDFKGFYGYRNFVIMDKAGNYCIKADSVWFHYNTLLNRPQKPEDERVQKYMDADSKRLDMTPIKRKLISPDTGIYKEEIPIGKHHIDSNNHVNNAKYISMARDAAEKDGDLKYISASYKTAARMGDIIIPRVFAKDNVYTVDLQDKNGVTFALVQLGF